MYTWDIECMQPRAVSKLILLQLHILQESWCTFQLVVADDTWDARYRFLWEYVIVISLFVSYWSSLDARHTTYTTMISSCSLLSKQAAKASFGSSRAIVRHSSSVSKKEIANSRLQSFRNIISSRVSAGRFEPNISIPDNVWLDILKMTMVSQVWLFLIVSYVYIHITTHEHILCTQKSIY